MLAIRTAIATGERKCLVNFQPLENQNNPEETGEV